MEHQLIHTPDAVDGLSRLRRQVLLLLMHKKQLPLAEVVASCVKKFTPHATVQEVVRETLKMTAVYPVQLPLLQLLG